jgi:hypothetical protein
MWNYDSLIGKAKVFVRRGLEHEHVGEPEIPFWCFLSLELVARATLAKVHPALLADPKEGANILFAFGFPGKKSPISIPAKTVFLRCSVVVPEFTDKDFEFCMGWMHLRNIELHTGDQPLVGLRTGSWQPEFLRILNLLLSHNGEEIEEFVGEDSKDLIPPILEALSQDKRAEARSLIRAAKSTFDARPVAERLELIGKGTENRGRDWGSRVYGQECECPACDGPAIISGKLIRSTVPRDVDGELHQNDFCLPTKLRCYACGLFLDGHGFLHAIDKGDQFSVVDVLDPQDFYGIEYEPRDDYPDAMYGND